MTGAAARDLIASLAGLFDWSLMWVKILIGVVAISIILRVWVRVPVVTKSFGCLGYWFGVHSRRSMTDGVLAISHLGREYRDNSDGDGPESRTVPHPRRLETARVTARQPSPMALPPAEEGHLEDDSPTFPPLPPGYEDWDLFAVEGDPQSEWTALIGNWLGVVDACGYCSGSCDIHRLASQGGGGKGFCGNCLGAVAAAYC